MFVCLHGNILSCELLVPLYTLTANKTVCKSPEQVTDIFGFWPENRKPLCAHMVAHSILQFMLIVTETISFLVKVCSSWLLWLSCHLYIKCKTCKYLHHVQLNDDSMKPPQIPFRHTETQQNSFKNSLNMNSPQKKVVRNDTFHVSCSYCCCCSFYQNACKEKNIFMFTAILSSRGPNMKWKLSSKHRKCELFSICLFCMLVY